MTTPRTVTIEKAHVSTKGLRFKTRAQTTGITIHCSASRPSQNWGAAEIDRMHRAQGWLCIGYHYVIRRDGVIEEGRPVAAEGSHCRDGGRNRTNIGICLIGGISEKPLSHKPGWPWNGSDSECNFTPAQMKSLHALVTQLDLPCEGHRDVAGVTKACPSFDVHHWATTGELKN
jgi:N-acetylmuramoyl-L-alanine amidase